MWNQCCPCSCESRKVVDKSCVLATQANPTYRSVHRDSIGSQASENCYNLGIFSQVSALLTGVHRAYPFAIIDSEVMAAQMETMYKIAQMSNFNIAIHAFMLLFQVSNKISPGLF